MQVHVDDLLAGGLTVSEEEVDALAADCRVPKGRRGKLPRSEKLRAVLLIKVGKERSVIARHYQHVTARDRLDVHEGHCPLVLMDDAYLCLARGEAAKQALTHLHRSSRAFRLFRPLARGSASTLWTTDGRVRVAGRLALLNQHPGVAGVARRVDHGDEAK